MAGVGLRVALGFTVMLAGCSDGVRGASTQSTARGTPSVQVMSKSFTISGPRGFCIDEAAMRETAAGAFVMLGSCAAISGNNRDAKPRIPAVLTASVAAAETPLDDAGLDRLAAFFATDEGRSTLARSEDAEEVVVLELSRDDNLVLVHARDGARAGDMAGDYWRGVFSLAGQLVTVTVAGFRAAPLDETAGTKLARDFAEAIRRANRAPSERTAVGGGGGLAAFFNRLL
ncbi:hypothetical protein [Sinisalibacter lacisalsi]|uniref:TPM domain-containing protein n=1 Tax=Sinisalibacter lacisalsi TaxID=1526570 RepID=A0ABQ1QN08_9RHOB|nr:hypothetical protein [Sinisalibacter lacisalsi]GGD37223.1 hypothetical protein GCM10011358_21230 [Sinisalibacter lacisalsi]